MRFVKDFVGRDISFDCLECSLAKKSIISPGSLIYEDDKIIVHPHTTARMIGFIVVAPKRHVKALADLTNEEREAMFEAGEFAAHLLIEKGYATDTVLHTKADENGHFQFWIVGNYSPVLEKDFDIAIFDSQGSMERRGLKRVMGKDILLMTQVFKSEFRKKYAKWPLSYIWKTACMKVHAVFCLIISS